MRDAMRKFQLTRKEIGLEIEDRITMTWQSDSPTLIAMFNKWAKVLKANLLAVSIERTNNLKSITEDVHNFEIEGERLMFTIKKADLLETALYTLNNEIRIKGFELIRDNYDCNKEMLLFFRLNNLITNQTNMFLTLTSKYPRLNHKIYITSNDMSVDVFDHLIDIANESKFNGVNTFIIKSLLDDQRINTYYCYEDEKIDPTIKWYHPSTPKDYIRAYKQYYTKNVFVDMILQLLGRQLTEHE